MTHGCYAKVHHLPDEDPQAIARLRERWLAGAKANSVADELLAEEVLDLDP